MWYVRGGGRAGGGRVIKERINRQLRTGSSVRQWRRGMCKLVGRTVVQLVAQWTTPISDQHNIYRYRWKCKLLHRYVTLRSARSGHHDSQQPRHVHSRARYVSRVTAHLTTCLAPAMNRDPRHQYTQRKHNVHPHFHCKYFISADYVNCLQIMFIISFIECLMAAIDLKLGTLALQLLIYTRSSAAADRPRDASCH